MQSHHTINIESIRREIAERVRPSCADMAEDEFEKMISRMALIEWKHFNDSTPTRRVVTSVPRPE